MQQAWLYYWGEHAGCVPSPRQAGDSRLGTAGRRGQAGGHGGPAVTSPVHISHAGDGQTSLRPVNAEGGMSPGCRLPPAPAARPCSHHRAGLDLGGMRDTPTSCPPLGPR